MCFTPTNVCAAYERAGSPLEKCETCRGDARTWRCLWRLLQKLCLSGGEPRPREWRAVRVRTIIGSVRVSGTQTPSTDSEVRRPLGSQEEELFNKIQSIICTLVLNKIFKWHLTLPPLHIDIFYKERNMLATYLPSQFKSFYRWIHGEGKLSGIPTILQLTCCLIAYSSKWFSHLWYELFFF